MGSSYIVKVRFEDSLRRVIIAGDELDFANLDFKVRNLFKILSPAELVYTYTDNDGDLVRMADDEDLKDALVLQALNPLRLAVTFSKRNLGSSVTHPERSLDSSPAIGADNTPTVKQGLESEPAEGPASLAAENDSAIAPADDGIKSPATKLTSDESNTILTGSPSRPAPTAALNESSSDHGEKSSVVHHGIQCDGCGMKPIVGPRLISQRRWNYDLCTSCFNKSGEDSASFHRVDEPGKNHPILLARPPTLMDLAHHTRYLRAHFLGPYMFWAFNQNKPEVDSANRTEVTNCSSASNVADINAPSNSKNCEQTQNVAEQNVNMDADKKSSGQNPSSTTSSADAKVHFAENLSSSQDIPVIHRTTGKVPKPEVDVREQRLLAKLAAMGFTDETLNADILARTKFDLRRTVNELCAANDDRM